MLKYRQICWFVLGAIASLTATQSASAQGLIYRVAPQWGASPAGMPPQMSTQLVQPLATNGQWPQQYQSNSAQRNAAASAPKRSQLFGVPLPSMPKLPQPSASVTSGSRVGTMPQGRLRNAGFNDESDASTSRTYPVSQSGGMLSRWIGNTESQRSVAPVNFVPETGAPTCPSCGVPSDACGCHMTTLDPIPFEGEGCTSCGSELCGGTCTTMPTCHKFMVTGEYLYLRSRDAGVAYAVPIDGPVTSTLGNGIQIGPTAVADINHQSGFRVGVAAVLCDGATLGGMYTHFESHVSDQAFVQAPFVMRSLVTHPLGANAATDSLRAWADYDIDFDFADLAYQANWLAGDRWRIDYLWGVRYGQLNQMFGAQFDTNGLTAVATDVDFNGAGPRVGLDVQRDIGCVGLYLYSRGDAAFLAGKTDATYRQADVFSGTVVDTGWESGRIVTQAGLELGLGWATSDGDFHLSGGYMVSAWYNTVRTDEFVQAVQYNDFVGLGDGLTFDGLVVHGELRF